MEIKDKTVNKRQFFFLIGVLAILIAAGGYLYYRHQANIIREQKYTELAAIAKLKIDQLVQWRKERIADARVYSSAPFLAREVGQWLQNKNNKTLKEDLIKRIAIPQKENEYQSIFLASAEGELLLSKGSTLDRFDPVTYEKIRNAAKIDTITISDFYYCKTEKTIHYDNIVPLKDENNRTIAVLILRINPYDYLYPLIQSWPVPSKTSETLITRKEGDSVLFLNDLRFRTGAALSLKISLNRTDIPAVRSVLGYEGIFEGKDYRGVGVLSDIRSVPGTAWSMIAKVDQDEIFADLHIQAIIIIVFASLLMLVCGFGVMWIYHYRQRNIYRMLWNTQEEFRTTLYSIGDAVITTDTSGRVQDMNVVAEQLTGWKENDAKNKPLEEVFHIINEVTRIRVQNPVQLVLKDGLIVGLANHTLLISKDGKEVPIADSGSPIRDDKNEIIGVVLVFRDQTEERASQKLLQDSETKFRRLFEAARDGILILDAETGKIVDVNPFLIEMLGYTHEQFLGKNVWDLGFLKDIVANEAMFSELRQKEFIRYEDLPLETFDGRKMDVEFVSNVYLVDHHKVIQCNIRDITERNQAEKLQYESELKYRQTFDISPIGIVMVGLDKRFIKCNNAFSKSLGYLEKDLVGKTIEDITLPEDKNIGMAEMSAIVKGEIEVSHVEKRYVRKDGRVIWGEVTISLVRDSEKHPQYFLAIIQDINARKQMEEALRESEEHFRATVENSEAGYFFIDKDGIIRDVNTAWVKLYRYDSKEEILGQHFAVLQKIDDLQQAKEFVEGIMQGDVRFMNGEFSRQCKDGTIGYHTFSARRVSRYGKIAGIEGFIIDITERKRADEEQKRSEEKYRSIFENTQDVYYETLLDGTVLEVSPSIELVSKGQYHRTDLIGRSMFEFYANIKDRDVIISLLQKIGIISDFQVQLKNRDGTLIYCSISAKVIFSAEGSPEKIIGSMHDVSDRKQAQDALQESELRFRSLYENSTIGLYRTTPDGKIILANPTLIKMLGYKSFDELATRDLKKDGFEPSYERKQFIDKIELNGDVLCLESAWKRQDGSIAYISESARAIRGPDGKTLYYDGSVEDITERKKAEEELSESETRYRSVLQSATDAIVTADSSGIIIGWNSGAERIFGYSYTEAVGQSLISLMPLSYQAGHSDGMKRVLSGGDQHVIGKTVELEGLRKDNSVFPIELSLSTWKTTSCQFFTGIIRDITDRKRVEESLQETSDYLENLLSFANAPIMVWDNNLRITKFNLTFERMTGYTMYDVMDKHPEMLFPNEVRSDLSKYISRTVDGENLLSTEFPVCCKDGSIRNILWNTANIYSKDSKTITATIAIGQDITDHKKSEEAMRQMQKLEGLGTLAGGIAHDFNNILGIILAYNTSIKKFKDDAKKLDLATETITKAVDRGKTLVQQILMFARKTETTFGAVNVNDIVMEIMTMILETFPKMITYSQNFDKNIPYINADRSQLHQVLMNLCVNARDAMPNGGVLNINTRIVSVASLRAQHPDAVGSSYACIEVSDTGEGMTEETRKRIFELFFTTKGIGKGTGLGLSVTFGVIQAHKGFIDVESELGKGTTFRIYLPASEVAKPVKEIKEEKLEEISGGSETLLVVEDEEMLLMSLQMVLVDKGYKVITAKDGLTALKIYQEKKKNISLVLTDLGLPNISGLEVCRQIKKINPNERMILATGFLDPEMKAKFLKEGIDNFLFKPYNLTNVLKIIREIIDKK